MIKNKNIDDNNTRRLGDTIRIDGGYQHRAMYSKNAIQRFWHHTKFLIINELLPPKQPDFVIDVGCGSGVITSYLGKYSRKVLGIDCNSLAISYARRHFKSENVDFIEALVDENLILPEQPVKVYCLELIEHIFYEQALMMLRNIRNLSAQGVMMLITTPNYKSMWPAIEWAMDRFTSAPQMDEHQHVTRYDKKRLMELALKSGWHVKDIRTISFLSPWIAPLSWKLATTVHYIEEKTNYIPGSIIVSVLQAK